MVREDKGERSKLRREVGFFGVLGQSVAGVAPTTTPDHQCRAGLRCRRQRLVVRLSHRHMRDPAGRAQPAAVRARISRARARSLNLPATGLGPWASSSPPGRLLIAYVTVSAATLAGSTAYLSALVRLGRTVAADPVLGRARGPHRGDLRSSRHIACRPRGCWRLNVSRSCWSCCSGWRSFIGKGMAVDLAQFEMSSISAGGLGNALLIAVLSFAGFEAAATLGDESKKPLRDIPRALVLTPLLAGMFFVFAAYVIVLGFNRYNIAVATSSAPLDDLAHALNLPGLGTLVALGNGDQPLHLRRRHNARDIAHRLSHWRAKAIFRAALGQARSALAADRRRRHCRHARSWSCRWRWQALPSRSTSMIGSAHSARSAASSPMRWSARSTGLSASRGAICVALHVAIAVVALGPSGLCALRLGLSGSSSAAEHPAMALRRPSRGRNALLAVAPTRRSADISERQARVDALDQICAGSSSSSACV